MLSQWSLSGSDAGDFTVNEQGELRFRYTPDFEAPADSGRDNVYEFSVRASDGSNYGYLGVTVTVEDVNEAPVITTTSKTSFTYRENGTATIYTFSATDPEGATISWSPGGSDGGDFTITADSRGRGVLAFARPPDFESPTDADRDNVYEFTVVATDDQGLTDSVEVTVTGTDQNEGPVVSGSQSLSFQATDRIRPSTPPLIRRTRARRLRAGVCRVLMRAISPQRGRRVVVQERAGLRAAGGFGARQRL